jgi:hypothetical protein
MGSRKFYTVASLAVFGLVMGLGGIKYTANTFCILFPGQERGNTDFYQFWAAGRDFRAGQSLYRDLQITRDDHRGWLGNAPGLRDHMVGLLPVNAYPPFATLIFIPLSYLTYSSAVDVWLLTSLVCVMIASGLIARELASPVWKIPVAMAIAAAATTSAAFAADVKVGNIGSLLLLLVTLCWVTGRRRMSGSAGFFAALATMLKLYPGVLVVFFALSDRRAMCAMLAWLATFFAVALAVFGWDDHTRFLHRIPQSKQWYANPGNHSVFGWWHRLAVGQPAGIPADPEDATYPRIVPVFDAPWLAGPGASATAIVLTTLLFVLGRRHSCKDALYDSLFAATVVLMTLASPICWTSNQLVQRQ